MGFSKYLTGNNIVKILFWTIMDSAVSMLLATRNRIYEEYMKNRILFNEFIYKSHMSGNPVMDCNPMDCSPPGSSVCGILQARIMEWVAISFSRGSSRPRDHTLLINYILWKSCLGIQFLVLSTWYGNFLCYKIKRKA